MRKFIICLLCLAVLLCGTAFAAEEKAPVALFTFDNGDLSDSSGNGYHGTAAGAGNLSFVTAPTRGGVLELNNRGTKRNTGSSGFRIPTDGLKNAKNLNGKQVMNLFRKYRVSEYIVSCFEALHTTGTNYIIEDIDLYIEARQCAV